MGSRYEKLVNYKIRSSLRDFSKMPNLMSEEAYRDTVSRFLFRVLQRLPSSLSLDELKSFRKDKVARDFRKWLQTEFSRAILDKKITGRDLDEAMARDFLELTQSYSRIGSKLSWTVTGGVTIASSILAGPFAGVATATGSLILPKLVSMFWKRYGPRNWAYLLLALKK